MVHTLSNLIAITLLRNEQKTVRVCSLNRRLSGFALIVVMLFVPAMASAQLNVFACEPEWAALTKALGGDNVDVYSATTAMQDPHHVQARPSLIAKMRRADLLVCSGAELEVGWLPLLLRKAGNSRVMTDQGQFYAADYVDKLEVPERVDRSMGDVHAQGNPHIHTSPGNVLLVAEQLADRLTVLDAGNADHYRERHEVFSSQWQAAMQDWQQRASGLAGTKVITHHRFWSYLNDWLGIELVATLEPFPGVMPSSSYLASLVDTAGQGDVSFIMHVNYVNERPAMWLSERTGLPVVVLPASADYQADESLQQWFDGVIDKLVAAGEATADETVAP